VPEDDVLFVETVLKDLPSSINGTIVDKDRIYACGKSDGAGFSIYLATYYNDRIGIKAVVACSGAYFGTVSPLNFGTIRNTTIAVPVGVPLLELHGTEDEVMPYAGQNFTNSKAASSSMEYWHSIDPTVQKYGNVVVSDTYTASVYPYLRYVGGGAYPKKTISINGQTVYIWISASGNAVVHIAISGANHDWFGHTDSGPGSDQPSSLVLDTNVILARFLGIGTGGYQPTVSTDASEIPVAG
jgi:polyhydroxybutyrate depolymerase